MTVRLNGWQRSWCVGAAVLLAFIAFDAVRHMPTAEGIRAMARQQAAAAEERGRREVDPCQGKQPMTQFDLSMCEMKAEQAGASAHAASPEAIRQAAEVDIRDHLLGRQLEVAGRAGGSWLAIVVAAYAVGWSVGKARRAFGRERAR
jgi:hypothetical protein